MGTLSWLKKSASGSQTAGDNELQEKGAFFLSRLFKNTLIYDDNKENIDLDRYLKKTKKNGVDISSYLGKNQFSCRLVALRLPPQAYQQRLKNLAEKNRKNGHKKKESPSIFNERTVFITNLPLSVTPTLLKLYGLRWQIELFFKVIKTVLNLRDVSYHKNLHKALMAIYSALISAVLLTLCSISILEEEISLHKGKRQTNPIYTR